MRVLVFDSGVLGGGLVGGLDAVAAAAGLYDGEGCGYGTAVGESPAVAAAGSVHGFPAMRTSFVGRAGPARELADLLEHNQLVTVTGPGGSGKTRLACEVARRVAGRFADGVWLVELAPVMDSEQVPAVVAAALGLREQPGTPVAGTLARVLVRQQLLLVLDNCEHVIAAAAGLVAELVAACDDLRVLATSREGLRVAGEAGYRLGPLVMPDPDDLADAARAESVALFADRARQADAHFILDERITPEVARLVRRLDGIPLAIELAAARAEALGVSGLLDRLEDRFALLAGGDRLAPPRQRSLAATVAWIYQLLGEDERRVFRAVSVFPGPFTLEGAEAVAGAGAGLSVLRLVDCSLLVPPRAGADGRLRHVTLETLRAYGTMLLAEAGEQDATAAALAGWALRVAEEAAAGLQSSAGEVAAARRLDAEDPAMRQVLAWAMDHDLTVALRLAVALGWWWRLRGRLSGQYQLLSEVAGQAEPGSDGWCAAQFWLGWAAATSSADLPRAAGHFTAARDALQDRGPSRLLADVLASRSIALLNTGQLAEGTQDGRRALATARDLGDPAAEVQALVPLGIAALYRGDYDGAIELIRQQQQTPGGVPAVYRAGSSILIDALDEAGDLAGAESACAAALARCRDAGDMTELAAKLNLMADLEVRAGRFQDAATHLREGLQVVLRAGDLFEMTNVVRSCALLCTATGRYAEAATVWAAHDAHTRQHGLTGGSPEEARREEQALSKTRHALGPARVRAAEDRGAAMSLDTAAEYALLLTAPAPPSAAAGPGLGKLSVRERELVTLVAQGRTNAQIAAQLYISVRTVGSHLDRIRDKTGCRRRADLTRLALAEGLI